MKSYLHLFFLLHWSGSRLLFFLAFRCVVWHIVSLSLTLFHFLWLLIRLYDDSFPHSASHKHAPCVFVARPSPCSLFLVCVFLLFVFLVLFIVSCVSDCCAVLVSGKSHSPFRFSLFPKPVLTVSFAGCVFPSFGEPCLMVVIYFPLVVLVLPCLIVCGIGLHSFCVLCWLPQTCYIFVYASFFYPISYRMCHFRAALVHH